MKVFNLTDIETPVLVQRGLVEQSIGVSRRMIAPGEFVDVEDTSEVRARLEYLLTVGAVAIDQPPPPYVQARELKQARESRTGHLAGIPVTHVALQETKVVGELAPTAPPAGVEAKLERHSPVAETAEVADQEASDTRRGQGKKSRQ